MSRALGMATLGVQCGNKALGMAVFGVICVGAASGASKIRGLFFGMRLRF